MINKQITKAKETSDDNKQTILNVLKVTTLLIVTLIVLHCILNLYMCRTGNNNNNNITNNLDNNKDNITATIDTNVTATLKESPSEPDVTLTNTYVANVNGEILKIPVVTPHELNSLDAKTTGKITQTIDLTPVINNMNVMNNMNNKYKKNWEVGIGYGIHNGKSYVPVEIQRNYKADKAISIEFHKTTKGTQGYEIKHKWKL